MEAAAVRGGSLPPPPPPPWQPHRKEWRAVSEHPFRKNENEEVAEHVKLGQSDERTIYEVHTQQLHGHRNLFFRTEKDGVRGNILLWKVQEGTGPLDVDFCTSFAVEGGSLSIDILQQKLPEIARQQHELQQMETELRAQIIARSEIAKVQCNFDTQIKEHINVNDQLKEQLHERDQHIHELEMKLEEKERELRAVKIDNEAAWAKEDLLREQNKELATFQRERENSEAERTQHLKQIHELQEHIQEKVNQFLELEEQHRVARETIMYKDEQLREAQAWMARAQEVDTFHSTTNQTLQAELRECTEQFNQYLIGLQQQFAEVDRHHRQTIQQLQLELAEARERNGVRTDDSQIPHRGLRDSSSYVQNKGIHFINDGTATNGSLMFATKEENVEPFLSASRSSSKAEHAPGLPVVPSSILGLGAFLPSGQVIAPHPFVMHPQGTQQSVAQSNPHGPQSQMGYFHPITTITSHQHWQNQQAASDMRQVPKQDQQQRSQAEQNLLKSDAHYNYEVSVDKQVVNSDCLVSLQSSSQISEAGTSGSDENVQVLNGKELETNGIQYSTQEPRGTAHEKSQFQTALGLDLVEKSSESQINGDLTASETNQPQEQVLALNENWSANNTTVSTINHSTNSIDMPKHNVNSIITNEMPVTTVNTRPLTLGKVPEPTLLDEKSLLACIVRAIPAGSGGRIRISSTLPNRLGKMLAPLHWHDYKKQYGKLDDFVADHPELFVIEGDFIHLREGAQEIISATTAVAKVAAAAAASMPYSSTLPSVAVTPIPQHRLRKAPSKDLKAGKPIPSPEACGQVNSGDLSNKLPHFSTLHNQQPNGVGLNITHDLSDLKISKSRNPSGGLTPETRPTLQAVQITAGNGSTMDRGALAPSQNRGSSNGRHGFGGKQQRR